ncbi:MAG: dihydrodipicolinate synthase family protein [Candidatus Heimdallarchaeota archaeon]|nr:dihydrodipicolinate synthase family protein [Candidatus Heimdallarchaeota archaeon]
MAKKFKGIGCPCVTPFHSDETLDLTALRELVDYLINNEIHAILPTAHGSESYSLNDEEFHQVIDTVVDQVNGVVPVFIGLPTDNTRRILEIASYATDSGADGLVLYPPHIPQLNISELISHIEHVVSHVDNSFLIVNDPDSCKIDLPTELIAKLSKLSNVVGLIEMSNEFKKLLDISASVRDDFRVYAGRGLLVPQAIQEGKVEGAIVPSANVVPSLLVELYEALNVEMKGRFEELQTKLIPLEIGFKLGSFPAAIKAGLNLQGVNVGIPRRPVLPLSEADLERLRNILITAGFLRPAQKESSDSKDEQTTPPSDSKK